MKTLISIAAFLVLTFSAPAAEPVKWQLTFPNANGNGKAVVVSGNAYIDGKDDRVQAVIHDKQVMDIHAWVEAGRVLMTISPRFVRPRATGSFVIGGTTMTTSEPQLLEDRGITLSGSWARGAYLVTEEVRVVTVKIRY